MFAMHQLKDIKIGLTANVRAYEKENILNALLRTKKITGEINQTQSANILKIPESTLRFKVKKHGITVTTDKKGLST